MVSISLKLKFTQTDLIMAIITFVILISLFVLLGLVSGLKKTGDSYVYFLTRHTTNPWLAAISAIATNHSGYIFIGQVGFIYVYGLQAIWMTNGWKIGDFLTFLFIHKKLRIESGKSRALSYADLLSRWYDQNFKTVRYLGAFITLIFLSVYIAAQLKAGGKALHVLFDWNYSTGIILGSLIVLPYCLFGGMRASIWTDTLQTIIMMCAIALILSFSFIEIGDLNQFVKR